MAFEHLFSPIKIGKVVVPNRVVHLPTDINSGSAFGEVTERNIAFHEEQAKGGTGMIIVGCTTVDRLTGQSTPTETAADADCYVPSLHRLANAIHRHGSVACIQLFHPGRQAAVPADIQVSPSDMITNIPANAGAEIVYEGMKPKGKVARMLTIDEIYDLAEKYSLAAWRCMMAGFDCVELHGAHGYLIASFMSPFINKRNDRFGGSFENRMRFVKEIVERIQMKCGMDFPIIMRYSGEEYMPGSRELDESVEIAKYLEGIGVAALDISAGVFEAAGPCADPFYYKEGWNNYTARAIKEAVNIPVIASHAFRNPDFCDKTIEVGDADMIGFSRQLIADPYWANKAKFGKVKEIRRCTSCLLGCITDGFMKKRSMKCTINPAISDERFLSMKPARTSMNVAIVGGGVAGMEAARISALRGHKVTIFEKENELGGMIRTCCMVPPKYRWKWYIDWQRLQMEDLGVNVKLNTVATVEELKNYDVVLCGTGAKTFKPDIPGIEKAVDFQNTLRCVKKNCEYWPKEGKKEPVQVGDTVIIWGDHYAAGDTAEAMALRGKKVIVVTESPEFCKDYDVASREVMLLRLEGKNGHGLEGNPVKRPADFYYRTTVLEIRDGEAVLLDSKFNRFVVKCDDVILARQVPNDDLYKELKAAGVMVTNIGDSKEVRSVHGAMRDGAEAAIILDDDIFMNANGAISYGLPIDVQRIMDK